MNHKKVYKVAIATSPQHPTFYEIYGSDALTDEEMIDEVLEQSSYMNRFILNEEDNMPIKVVKVKIISEEPIERLKTTPKNDSSLLRRAWNKFIEYSRG